MNSQSLINSISSKSELSSMSAMLDKINKAGYSDSRIERSLDFPRGQLSLWRDGKITIERVDYALFRILYHYPEFIELAECGYDLNRFMNRLR